LVATARLDGAVVTITKTEALNSRDSVILFFLVALPLVVFWHNYDVMQWLQDVHSYAEPQRDLFEDVGPDLLSDHELAQDQGQTGENAVFRMREFKALQHSLPLGEGGYGQVFAVMDQGDRWLAFKLCFDVNDAKQQVALKSEICVMRRLKHPNIVQFLGTFESDDEYAKLEQDTPCLGYVMELCAQGTLADLLSHVGFVNEATGAWFIRDMLSALAFLHARRIIHRDVKPSNLMFDSNSVLKLADFGAAIHPFGGADDRRGKLQGTLLYLPPEAITSKSYGPAMDVWAVGCVALELLALTKGVRVYDNDFLSLRCVCVCVCVCVEREREREGESCWR